MRYNENDGEEINGKIVINKIIDDNPIFEVSCIVIGNISAEEIKANYDLVVVGNIEASKIEVSGNFSCLGNCYLEEIAVQGSCLINGYLSVEEGFIGDSLNAHEICLESLEVKGTIVCSNFECNSDVQCDKYVLIAEGLTGTGSLTSYMTICGEYSMLEKTNGVFIADSLEIEKNNDIYSEQKTEDIELIIEKAKKHKASVFIEELKDFINENEEYTSEYKALKRIMSLKNSNSIPSIKTYVEIIDLINRKYKIINNTKIFLNIKKLYSSYTYDDINHSVMKIISEKDFAKILYILTFKGQYFAKDIQELILETIYTYVGIEEDIFKKSDTK